VKKTETSLYRIRTIGDPALRQQAREVTDFDKQLLRLVSVMFELMEDADGVGLAATQIGVQKQVVVSWRSPRRPRRATRVACRYPAVPSRSPGLSASRLKPATPAGKATRSRPQACWPAYSNTRWIIWKAG
jgi:hypothetical protein